MTTGKAYSINESKAISETLEGETIIINLETGTYYSLNPSGSVLWGAIQKGHSDSQIAEHFVARYDGEPEAVAKSAAETIAFLLNEGLIAETDATAPELGPWTAVREVFVAPAVTRYEDMQEMLLADPIHDVDESTGWPTLKK